MTALLAAGMCCLALAHGGSVEVRADQTRLLSPTFGYTVAYRGGANPAIALFLYDHGRWLRSPLPIGRDTSGVDAVAFSDRLHGWVALYDCARAAVFLYRTRDGGRSWQALGRTGTHSCGGGPTYLSFVDSTHGWMEPVSPNGPGGELLATDDGGRTWALRGSLGDLRARLPCLAPIEFVDRAVGWLGRCGRDVYRTADGGRSWRRVPIGRGRAFFDLPRFDGERSVIAATLGGVTSTSVAFYASTDAGRTWTRRATRPIASCELPPDGGRFVSYWPAAEASSGNWWVVSGGRAQSTVDSGRHWRSVVARGLPGGCRVISVTAADARLAWVVARVGGTNTALFETRDRGRTWRRLRLLG